ncbi:hypothetical protein GCM10023148_57600 [Actinokineospora soli]
MFFNDLAASQAKAQAVQAMRTYEASLRGGEALVSVPGDVGSRSYGVAGGGMSPPVGQRGGGTEDEEHENRMPVLDHGLFAVDAPISAPVIGACAPGGER